MRFPFRVKNGDRVDVRWYRRSAVCEVAGKLDARSGLCDYRLTEGNLHRGWRCRRRDVAGSIGHPPLYPKARSRVDQLTRERQRERSVAGKESAVAVGHHKKTTALNRKVGDAAGGLESPLYMTGVNPTHRDS